MKNTANKAVITSLAILLALPLAAQAGRSEAETALTQATGSVAAAERAGATRNASVEFQVARDLFGQAQRACEDRKWDDCETAAEKARADARLAEARSRQRRAEEATAEIEAAVETLRSELARRGG
jgi:hypothetical protein